MLLLPNKVTHPPPPGPHVSNCQAQYGMSHVSQRDPHEMANGHCHQAQKLKSQPPCTPQPLMGCRAMLPWLVLPLLVRGHGDDDAHAHAVNSISDCPDATWSYRDHKCYKLTHEWHTFDECNRVYCPLLAAGNSTIACVSSSTVNGINNSSVASEIYFAING